MEATEFQDRVKRLEEVNKVITQLDPAIREQAFSLLKPYIIGGANDDKDAPSDGTSAEIIDVSAVDAGAFFTTHPAEKPSENALLCAAFFFSQYGSQPFSVGDIQAIADSVGITVPSRVDMTIRAAQRENKALFQRVARDKYRPTVHGEQYFKTNYQVKKGTKQLPAE
jgi:hypothetical protein